MRFAFLPLMIAISAPAAAQTAPLTLSIPNTTPVDGWGADSGGARPPVLASSYKRAQMLVAEGRYADADPLIDKMMARSDNYRYRILKGVTMLGLGDAPAARRYFERAASSTSNGDLGALSGLAIAHVRMGNRDAALAILDQLKVRQVKCADACKLAPALRSAVGVVEKSLT